MKGGGGVQPSSKEYFWSSIEAFLRCFLAGFEVVVGGMFFLNMF